MKKLITIQTLSTLKIGDTLMYYPHNGYNLDDFTFEGEYPIVHIGNDEVIVVNDKGEERRLENSLVKGYFRLISKVSDNVNHPEHYTSPVKIIVEKPSEIICSFENNSLHLQIKEI